MSQAQNTPEIVGRQVISMPPSLPYTKSATFTEWIRSKRISYYFSLTFVDWHALVLKLTIS